MVVDDQIARDSVEAAFAADRQKRGDGKSEPWLELCTLARSESDAVQQLESFGEDQPDVIVFDDYLPYGDATASRALHLMSRLCRDAIRQEVPLADRPRVVLWSTCEDDVVYTFCVLGGLQYSDKRQAFGRVAVPVAGIWRALAGERWTPIVPCPDESLVGERWTRADESQLHEDFRRALPYLADGWQHAAIEHELGLGERRLRDFVKNVCKMPYTPSAEGRPATATAALKWVRKHGWAWVPLELEDHVPDGAPFGKVLEPAAHRMPLAPAGPLPAGVPAAGAAEPVP